MRHAIVFASLAILVTLVGPTPVAASDACRIVEQSINFRFNTLGFDRTCGTDPVSNEKFCLRKPSNSFFVSDDKFQLDPHYERPDLRRLHPVIKLDEQTKLDIKSSRQNIFAELLALSNREKQAKAEASNDSTAAFLASIYQSDIIGGYYQREIKRWTNSHGASHPKVLELQKVYNAHQRARRITSSQSTKELKSKVDYVEKLNFDRFERALNANEIDEFEINAFLASWNELKWQKNLNCTDKIFPSNPMVVPRGNKKIVVQTGKEIENFYLVHPKTFLVKSLAFSENKTYAIIFVWGHHGGSHYEIGGPPTIYLLQNKSGEWPVIASTGAGPIFY